MSVPEYQAFMLPLLLLAADGAEHRSSEAVDRLVDQFLLTDEDLRELLPSGNQTKLVNRVGWAKTYLTKAGLLESAGYGRFRITDRGQSVLKEKPATIDAKFLTRYSEFKKFRATTEPEGDESKGPEETAYTPEESLEASYLRLRRQLAAELLAIMKACSPRFFEKLVVDLLVAMGYGGSRKDAGEAIGHSGDEGIDGIIKEDKLGLDVVYIQAKRWGSTVGRPVVHAFAGSLEGQRARRGVLITTSQFSQDAKDFVNRIEKRIVLMDGEQLAQLMIDHGVGVTEVATYAVKRVDSDYFIE